MIWSACFSYTEHGFHDSIIPCVAYDALPWIHTVIRQFGLQPNLYITMVIVLPQIHIILNGIIFAKTNVIIFAANLVRFYYIDYIQQLKCLFLFLIFFGFVKIKLIYISVFHLWYFYLFLVKFIMFIIYIVSLLYLLSLIIYLWYFCVLGSILLCWYRWYWK